MPMYVVNYNLPIVNRVQMRQSLITVFLNEVPGTGRGDNTSRYQYNVEIYGNYGIYLRRPTRLNKGFDFTVHVKGMYFKKNKRYSNPSHQDIFDALTDCRNSYPNEYGAVVEAIRSIYYCIDADLSQIHASYHDYEGREHPIQVILLAIKWLFMEQDCAYWNYSGRGMLFEGLRERGLV